MDHGDRLELSQQVLQTCAFAFQPAVAIWCSQVESSHPVQVRSLESSSRGGSVERTGRFELPSSVWKTEALPLGDIRIVNFRLSKNWHRWRESNSLATFWRRVGLSQAHRHVHLTSGPVRVSPRYRPTNLSRLVTGRIQTACARRPASRTWVERPESNRLIAGSQPASAPFGFAQHTGAALRTPTGLSSLQGRTGRRPRGVNWRTGRYSKPQPPPYQSGALPLAPPTLELELSSGLEPEPSCLRGRSTATRALTAKMNVNHAELFTHPAPLNSEPTFLREVHFEPSNHFRVDLPLRFVAPKEFFAFIHGGTIARLNVAAPTGIEPASTGRQPAILPLNDRATNGSGPESRTRRGWLMRPAWAPARPQQIFGR